MSPFGQLFWGFLIVFIDIRINGFDLLIDLVGYIFIVIGLGELAKRNLNFERAPLRDRAAGPVGLRSLHARSHE